MHNIFLFTILYASCSMSANHTQRMQEPSSLSHTNRPVSEKPTTAETRPEEIYTQAIAEYIAAVYQKDNIHLDTLFLGKNPEFPDMDLPETIGGAEIRLLTMEEAAQNKSSYSKSSPFINLVGFIDSENAEFIFVTFFPEFNHQYDCYINLVYNSEQKKFLPEQSRIEVLVRNKDGMADHFEIYVNGKATGSKPIQPASE